MKTILQFLKGQIEPISESSEEIDATERDIAKLRDTFKSRSESPNQTKHLKIKPRAQKNQIWTVKTEYDDFQGIRQKAPHPFIILISSETGEIEGEDFARVFIVSPFIEIASETDEVCQDPSIIGFPFLVENWNNQPMLTELLEEYIGYYEPKSFYFSKVEVFEMVNDPSPEYSLSKAEKLSDIQQEFRNIEISRARYINHSVLSVVSFLENRQSEDACVVISLLGKTEYPKFFIGQTKKEPHLALAAKSRVESEDKYLILEDQNLPFQIFFRKNEDGFIISIQSTDKFKLLTSMNEEIHSISNNEKIVFANLKEGKYALISEQFQEPIKIRLK